MISLHPTIRLRYLISYRNSDDGKDMDYRINLLEVLCHFGGKRWYFECCICRGRVAKLYDFGDYFCCRRCANLSYDSCNKSKKYRGGIWGFLKKMWGADDYYRENVKRMYYKGAPTRKYQRYLDLSNNYNEEEVETSIRKINKDLGIKN